MSEKKRTVDEIKEIDELENFLSGCGESNIECISNWLTQDQIREVAEQLWDAGYRKKKDAEWILHSSIYDYEVDTYRCSGCGAVIRSDEKSRMRYCPGCGAKMEGGAE